MNSKEQVKKKIMELLYRENRAISISEIAKLLKESGIKKSQPVIKDYLEELEKENKVMEEK